MLAGKLARRIGTGTAIAIGAVAFSAPFLFLPLASGSTVARVATLASIQFVSTAGVMLFDINLNAVQTAVIPNRMRSRVTGVFGTINYGVRPIGAALGVLSLSRSVSLPSSWEQPSAAPSRSCGWCAHPSSASVASATSTTPIPKSKQSTQRTTDPPPAAAEGRGQAGGRHPGDGQGGRSADGVRSRPEGEGVSSLRTGRPRVQSPTVSVACDQRHRHLSVPCRW